VRALLLDFSERRPRLGDLPEPAGGEVRLRILECGTCGTDRDLAAFAFGAPPAGESQLILGHEAVAEVAASSNPALPPGTLVVPAVRRACPGPCASCATGRRDLCLTGAYRERGILGLHGYCAEWAVDRAEDLFPVPRALAGVAVLVEPMSVVEKACDTAVRLHPGLPARLLVLGAGAVGILAAWAGLQRGWQVTVVSREPEDGVRARLLRAAGVTYRTTLPAAGAADLIIEACGAAELAAASLACLRPLGVLVALGARNTTVPMPFLDLIVGNQTIAGSVNAGPEHFRQAIATLTALEPAWLRSMIERRPLHRALESLAGPVPAPGGDAIKVVHTLH
jgi:threonine dehydrogenase-like Zn-dependent dehydrogenase